MDYTSNLHVDDTQATINVPADILQQIDEQLGEEFVRREDFIQDALRYRLAQYQHKPQSTKKLQKV